MIRRMNDPTAMALQNCGDRDNPSVSVSMTAYTLQAKAQSKDQKICTKEWIAYGTPHAVCFQTGHTKGNGSGVNTENVAYTLESVNGGGMAVMDIFRLDPESSNSMKSSNPYSGCHRENVCHTIDATVPNPSKGQGGMAIVEMS